MCGSVYEFFFFFVCLLVTLDLLGTIAKLLDENDPGKPFRLLEIPQVDARHTTFVVHVAVRVKRRVSLLLQLAQLV